MTSEKKYGNRRKLGNHWFSNRKWADSSKV